MISKLVRSFASLRMNPRKNMRGFTYIEMLIVIALVAMCFVPLIQMFAKSMDEVDIYSNFGTAVELGREQMEAVKNLRLTEAQLEKTGVQWVPPQNEPLLLLNRVHWRVQKTAVRGTDPLEVRIDVFREDDLKTPVVELITLIEDL